MKRSRFGFTALAVAAAAALAATASFGFGCSGGLGAGGGAVGPDGGPIGPRTADGGVVDPGAAAAFQAGLALLQQHDDANDWTDATCEQTAKKFLEAEDKQGKFHEARYNAGVAYQRCKNETEAKKIFTEILGEDEKYHRARVQLALYKFKESGEKDIEGAIGEMQRAVRDSEFKNVEALMQLSMLQMRRQNDKSDDGDNDLDRAKKNLQRALAINDGFMPAFNQLAIYYLQRAKEAATGKDKGARAGVASATSQAKKANSAALELAALVCSQAVRKNPNYGPVYNTSGLISAEQGDLSAAAQSFGKARQLDPKFYEAHMNYAAVNLLFRGFPQAEQAYRDALKLRDEYDAHLGLALAIRGQILGDEPAKLKEALDELEKAKKMAPDRAETYYNQAILVQEFKARTAAEKDQEKFMLEAKDLFKQFIDKAGSKPEYKDGAKNAKERMGEIDQIIAFNKQTAEDKKKMEEEAKVRAAQEELQKTQAGETGPGPEGGEAPPPDQAPPP